MEMSDTKMDEIVLNVVIELVRELKPNLPDRDAIQQRVREHLREHIDRSVVTSLQRLEDNKRIEADRDPSQGRPYRYWLSPMRRL